MRNGTHHNTMTALLSIAVLTACITLSACGTHDRALDQLSAGPSTAAQTRSALLTTADLPARWAESPNMPSTDHGLTADLIDPQACSQAVSDMEATTQAWESAPVVEKTTFTTTSAGAQITLAEKITSDPGLDPRPVIDRLGRLISQCEEFTVNANGGAFSVAMAERDFIDDTGDIGDIGLVETWSSSTGEAMTARYAYLLRGSNVIVISLMSPVVSDIGDNDFSAIVQAASDKLAETSGE
ncbi:MAG: hypothetical protein ACRDTJ_12950 [Pseudonocardiaceae bacterium]